MYSKVREACCRGYLISMESGNNPGKAEWPLKSCTIRFYVTVRRNNLQFGPFSIWLNERCWMLMSYWKRLGDGNLIFFYFCCSWGTLMVFSFDFGLKKRQLWIWKPYEKNLELDLAFCDLLLVIRFYMFISFFNFIFYYLYYYKCPHFSHLFCPPPLSPCPPFLQGIIILLSVSELRIYAIWLIPSPFIQSLPHSPLTAVSLNHESMCLFLFCSSVYFVN